MNITKWTRKEICLAGAAFLISACAISAMGLRPGNLSLAGWQVPSFLHAATGISSQADQIVFLALSIRYDPRQKEREIHLQDLVKKPGKLKPNTSNLLPSRPYLCGFLYAGQVLLDSLKLEHPLYRHREYVGEKKQLRQLALTRNQADFYIRFQQGRATRIILEERLPGIPPKPLITIDL